MKLSNLVKSCLFAALAIVGTNLGWERTAVAQQDQAASEDGVEVLTRGPVHEAFAETVTFDPQPGILVPKAPPDPIEELPPDQKPEGENVDWIPGYWAWDEERDDFLWISGTWRALPPGREWVPGYWAPVGNEFQWTSGYWADASLTESEYLPEPPATVEAGPNIAAPSPDHIWAPGVWVWNQNRYAWRPGYWIPAQQNWVWIPPHYIWSPRGYVFVNGYFDYTVVRRGLIFAPVYFRPNVFARRGFSYSPAMAISLAVFGNQLFLRPNYGHYYFGDYYGPRYVTAGFQPWFTFHTGHRGYDPFFAHQRWQNRQNAGWAKGLQADFQRRVDHEDARPPRTLVAQQALLKKGDAAANADLAVVAPLDQIAKTKDSSVKLQPVSKEEKQKLTKQGQDIRQFSVARQKVEVKGGDAAAGKPEKGAEPIKEKLPKSPILAKNPDQLGQDNTPPKVPEAQPIDAKVEPKPRPARGKGEPRRGDTEPNADDNKPPAKGEPKPRPKPDKPMPEKPKPEKPMNPPGKKPEPVNPDPRPEPPKTKPMPAPKVEPKPEPKPVPKPQPMPEPKVKPMPMPKPEQPKPEPAKPERKEKPRKNDKEKPSSSS